MYVKWVLQSRWRTKTGTRTLVFEINTLFADCHAVCLVQKCGTRLSPMNWKGEVHCFHIHAVFLTFSCFRGGFISIPSKLNGAEAQIYNCSVTDRVFEVVVREKASSDNPLQNLAPKSKVPPLSEGILCSLNRPVLSDRFSDLLLVEKQHFICSATDVQINDTLTLNNTHTL